MGRGTFISAALHGAILLWVLVAFPSSNMDTAPLVAIPIDLATPGDVTKIKVGTEPHGLTVWPQPGRYSLGHTGNMR